MLDEQKDGEMLDDVEILEAQDDVQADVPDQDESAGDEITITIEGIEPEVVEDEAPSNSIRQMREALKDRERQIRELKAKIPVEAAQEAKADPRPELKDFQWDENAHADAVVSWAEREAARKSATKAQQEKMLATQQEFEKKQAKARDAGKALARDFDDIEATVKDALSANQVALIYHTVPNAEQMIYAIGRNPKIMSELSGETDLAMFTRKVSQLEGKIKVERKTPPPPEARVNGGGGVSRFDAAGVEKLRIAAEKSGDYSQYHAAKRVLQNSGK